MASDPWQGHDSTVLFALLLTGAPALIGLTAYLCSRLAKEARRRITPIRALRDASLTAVTVALALYLWGLLHVLFLDGQEQAHECERHRPEGIPELVGRRGDFVPLRLVCEASGGRDYSVVIPGYINPSVTVLLVLALVAAVASGFMHHKQRTPTPKEG
ncbi:hypothetical protein KBZ00_27225 [Streptomyces sp. RK31]|uniref:Uncharacterized protein n=1 Tax=Streptomyces labedae TaxID=285569 RepID=A0ABP6QZZ0_9ACTN|nr:MULTISPECIES: hypothetical protein [unclassified Streptomyces]MBJ6633791.1 hypothetical protein [Streptomyces sp. I5]MBQ0974792.1 hypothetical protein [Streptomyces sp. RK31]